MTNRDRLWRWLQGRPMIDLDAFLLEPDPSGYHCASCARYLSEEDGIVGIFAPGDIVVTFLGMHHYACLDEFGLAPGDGPLGLVHVHYAGPEGSDEDIQDDAA